MGYGLKTLRVPLRKGERPSRPPGYSSHRCNTLRRWLHDEGFLEGERVIYPFRLFERYSKHAGCFIYGVTWMTEEEEQDP